MCLVEALTWAKKRTEQSKRYLMPPFRIANLLGYISSGYSQTATIDRNPFGSENRSEGGRKENQNKRLLDDYQP